MLTPQAVCQQIKTLVGYLVEVGLSSDQNDAFVRSLRGNMTEVTFPGAENVSVALKDRNYGEIYAQLESTRAYIAKLPDGALILMRYSYRDGELLQHSLGFYPSPSLEEFQNNPEIYLEEAVFADVVARNIVPFPIRFDFDCRYSVVKPVTHPKSHLTLGQYENCRIPVSRALSPSVFVTFILRHFYNTAFVEYSERVPKLAGCFSNSIFPQETSMVHVVVPG